MQRSILVADHHGLQRQGLRSLLNHHGEFRVIGEARDGAQALSFIDTRSPDLLLIDARLPELGGAETAAQMKRRAPEVRIVMLTHDEADDGAREALRSGVDACVSRNASFEDLLAAMRRATSGRKAPTPAGSSWPANGGPTQPSNECLEHERIAKLTARERSIFLLISGGCTNRATAQQLCVSQKTVEKHRANLMRKIGVHSATELMIAAIDMGIVDRPALGRDETQPRRLRLLAQTRVIRHEPPARCPAHTP